ncbi:MAG: PAS domain-containing protein [Pseudanabaena sp.]
MRHAQESIDHPDNLLAEIMDSFDDLIWSLSLPSLAALYFNAAAAKIYQCSCDDLLGNGHLWLNLIAIDDQTRMQQAIAQAQKIGSSQITYRIQPLNGEVRCFSARLKVFKDSSGIPIRLDVIANEISDIIGRQNLDYAFQDLTNSLQQTHNTPYIEGVIFQSESNYRQIVEQQSDLILRSLADTTITFANEALCRMLGGSLENVIGKRWIDSVDPEDLQNVLYGLTTLCPEQSSFISVNRNHRTNGQISWTQWINQGFFNQQGELIEIQSVGRDITPLKSSELALKQLNEELEIRIEQRTADLHESESRYRAILQALPDLLLLLNPDGTCVQCILPSTYDKSKYIPIKHHISEVLSSETLAAQLTLYEKAIATGEVQIYEHQLTKFGKTVYEEVRIAPYCDDELLVIVRDVTDRQIIKQQLQTLTDRLTLALKSAAIGIWEWDIVNNSLFWDERTYELYGVNPDPSTDAYLDWASRIHPSDRPFAEAAVQKALNGEQDYEPEFRIVLPDGNLRYLKAFALIQRNDHDEPQRLIGINFDITAQKLAEEQLIKSDTHLKTAQRIGKLGSWEYEINTGKITWSDEVFRIYGIDPSSDPPTYDQLQLYVHPDDWEHFDNTVQTAMALQQSYDLEHRIIQINGSLIYVMARGEMVYDSSGQLTRIIGTAIDVTAQKLAEAELTRSRDLREALFNESTDALFLVDPQTLLTTDCNQPAARLFEASDKSQLIGIEGHTLQRSQFSDEEMISIVSEIEANGFWSRELEYITLQGKHFWGNLAVKAISVAERTINLVRVTDISDRKLAEAKIIKAANQLASTNRELESFSYSVSHDLRAPLRHMHGFVNALQQRLKSHEVLNDAKVSHYMQVIEKSSQKMGYLIDGLLTLSRYGRRPLESTEISIRTLVDEAIEIIRTDPHHNPLVEFEIGELPTVVGDPTLLQQVFHNLIGNSVKFSRNQPHPYVQIDSLPDQTVRIKDNGVGFQMEYADKLFGAFQRLHNEREFEGTGIGLAIVQRIVQRHDGLIWAEGYPDQGATFFIKFQN